MGKKDKREVGGGAPAAPLKHNPFAALLGKPADEIVAEAAPAPAPAPAPAAVETTKPAPAPPAASKKSGEKSRGRLVLRRETKHRGGKAVIIVSGFAELRDFSVEATEALAKQLKQQLGCGGTVEGEGKKLEIVLQGDRAAKVAELLRAQGYRVDGVTA